MTPERLQRIKAVLDQRQLDLTVLLDRVHKQRNHAAILRSCDAVGIQQLHIVGEANEHRPFRGTAMGSQRWVDVAHHESIATAVTQLRQDGMQIVAANYSASSISYRDIDYCRPTALVLGAEKDGVSDGALALVDAQVHIPMLGMVESFNVSVAAAIILNEAREQRARQPSSQHRLSEEQRQYYFFRWAYARLAAFCDQREIPYPPLDEQGDIIDPDGSWRALAKSKESLRPLGATT